MELYDNVLKIVSTITELVLDNLPKIMMLIALLAAYIEYKCKKMAYETALISLRENEMRDQRAPSPDAPTMQEAEPFSFDNRRLTPESFYLWAKHRREALQQDGSN